jgi:hypothetical protein
MRGSPGRNPSTWNCIGSFLRTSAGSA